MTHYKSCAITQLEKSKGLKRKVTKAIQAFGPEYDFEKPLMKFLGRDCYGSSAFFLESPDRPTTLILCYNGCTEGFAARFSAGDRDLTCSLPPHDTHSESARGTHNTTDHNDFRQQQSASCCKASKSMGNHVSAYVVRLLAQSSQQAP